jgi:signal transduction histidine kinase
MPASSRSILIRLLLPIGLLISWYPAFSQVIDANNCDSVVHLVITSDAPFLQTEQPITIDSVLKSTARLHEPFKKAVSIGNYDPYYYWFRIVVKNSRDKSRDLMLLMAPFGLYDGLLWQRVDGKWKAVAHTGLKYRFRDRSYQFTHHVFPFTLPASSVDTLYFSIDAKNAYKLFGFALFEPKQLKLFEGSIYFIFGIIVGLLVLFFVLNVSLYVALKEKLHLWYALYIALLFFVVMKNDQLDQQFLGLDSERAFRLTPYAAIGAFAIAILLHVVQQFLKKVLKKNRTLYRLSTILKFNVVCSAVAHAGVFFAANNARLENVVFSWVKISVLACICMMIIDCIYAYVRKTKEALFLLCGSFVFLIGSIQRLFAGSLSILFPPTMFHAGIILEVIIISVALVYRFWLERETLRTEREQIKIETINAISAEVHDNIGPTLTLASLNLKRIDFSQQETIPKKVKAAGLFTEIAISEIRDLSRTLRDGPARVLDIAAQVVKLCADFESSACIRTVCEIRGAVKLNNHQQASFVRIIKEALNNAMKHSQTPVVEVRLNFGDGVLLLTIIDTGVGFDVASVFPESNGLQNMYYRCRLMKGNCRIESKPGEGTQIYIELPVSLDSVEIDDPGFNNK